MRRLAVWSAPSAQVRNHFSEPERELIALVAQGQTDAQIAQKLFPSVRTAVSTGSLLIVDAWAS